eukprot:1631212-Amphidinium_carterae.1
MERAQEMPAQLMAGWVRPIPKAGFVASSLKLRPITILPLTHRLWSGIRYISPGATSHDIISLR